MTIARFLQKATHRRRPTCLAVVVLPDELVAFQAYRLLHYHGISPENLAIVGEGYSTLERVGVQRPMQIALRQARTNAVIFAVVGSVLCLVICRTLNVDWQRLLLLTELIGGLGGGCGGAVVGGLFGLLGEGNASNIYRYHLSQGRYLLLMEGPEKLVRWGQEVLSHYSTPSAH